MTDPMTKESINAWATDLDGPVALHLNQKLLPVGEPGVVYPPTYADIGYNIDTLDDGTKVALIDSVGSQANRMEPVFKREPYSKLVPQIEIELSSSGEGVGDYVDKRSVLDLAHRSADSVVHASPTLATIVSKAFTDLKQRGDSTRLCQVAPTSLVFGVWDSRGGSNEKLPRLVRSIVRAWDVDVLHTAAQFNSVWKQLGEEQRTALEREAKAKKVKLSEKGLADAPAVFRNTKMPQWSAGSPNPDARVLGGIVVRGRIERDVTVNLVALRRLAGSDDESTNRIRRYLLALTLIAATSDMDLYLREGCHLRYAGDELWETVPRRGDPTRVDLTSEDARETVLRYAEDAVKPFSSDWPDLRHKFDLNAAKKLLSKSNDDVG